MPSFIRPNKKNDVGLELTEKIISDLRNRLRRITDLNFNRFIEGLNTPEYNKQKEEVLCSLFNHSYFRNRRDDGRIEFIVGFQEEKILKVITDTGIALSPIPDEENLYCLCNPTSSINNVDQLPITDLLLSTYS